MNLDHVQATLTSEIYRQLFGKSRDELLAIAKKMPQYGIGGGISYAFDDEDESMRDLFNQEALQAMRWVEMKAAYQVKQAVGRSTDAKEGAAIIASIVLSVCKAVAKGKTIDPFAEDKE